MVEKTPDDLKMLNKYLATVSYQKRGETSRRFEWLNQFFEETFGTVFPHPQNIEKIPKVPPKSRRMKNQLFQRSSACKF